MAFTVALRTLYDRGDASTMRRLLPILLCALALSGCAANTAAPAKQPPAAPIPLPSRALLLAPTKPDCEFRETGLGDTVPDAAEAAHRESRCYRQAEMLVRVRLLRLQASVAKSIKAIKRSGR